MPTSLSQIMLLVMTFTATILIQPMKFLCDEEKYKYCNASLDCFTYLNLSYPFWGSDRPNYCGHPGFKLSCRDEALEITIMSISYRILQIDAAAQTLKVARTDYWNDVCPQYLKNNTFDLNLFSYSSYTRSLRLLYDCSPQSVNLPSKFSCNINSTGYVNLILTRDIDISNMMRCNHTVDVAISQSEMQTLQSNPSEQNLRKALQAGFELHWKIDNNVCNQCRESSGQCGSDPDSGEFKCYCSGGAFKTICGSTPSGVHSKKFTGWIKIVIATFGVLVMMTSIALFVYYKKKILIRKQVEEMIKEYGNQTPKRYGYSEVKKMTRSFKPKLGQGGYGIVYKGKLRDGRDVAVKLLNKSKGDGKEFINEVANISTTSHVNIVTLLGFCYERDKRALIYEYMPGGSLDKYIHQGGSFSNEHQLDWKALFNIVIGIARGLDYLHRGCNTRILHFDIKPHNILLDEDFCPKISDFGLAKKCNSKESYVSMTGTRRTPGFIAPEVFSKSFGKASHKSDVYSFKMLILEMVGQRKNHHHGSAKSSEEYFPDWIYENLKQSNNSYWVSMIEEEEELARKMIIVSLYCTQMIPSERPSMSEVIEMLGKSLDGLQIPPKPSLPSPQRLSQNSLSVS